MISLNRNSGFYFYKGEQYWNPKLRNEFLVNHSQLVCKEHYGLKRSERESFIASQVDVAFLPTSEPPRP